MRFFSYVRNLLLTPFRGCEKDSGGESVREGELTIRIHVERPIDKIYVSSDLRIPE